MRAMLRRDHVILPKLGKITSHVCTTRLFLVSTVLLLIAAEDCNTSFEVE